MWQVRKLKEDLVGVIIGVLVSFLTLSYVYSKLDFIEVTNDPSGIHVVKQGDIFEYCRDVKYLRDSNATIDKAIIRYEDGKDLVIVSFGSQNIFRAAGFENRVCKRLEITQQMDEGNWILETYVTRKLLPFWSDTVKLKDIYIYVSEDEQKEN